MAAVKSKKSTSKLKAGKKKPLNKWLILGGVAAVAVIGVAVVRFSGAGGYPFVRYASQMSTTDKQRFSKVPTFKFGGTTYADIGKGGSNGYYGINRIQSIASSSEISRSSKVCAHIVNNTNYTKNVVIVQYASGKSLANNANFSKKSSGNVCTKGILRGNSTIGVSSQNGAEGGQLGVNTIYGKY